MASNQTQRMFNPETGKFGDVPLNMVEKATSDGLEVAVQLYNPETKQQGWVPKSAEKQALSDGLQLVEIPRSLTPKQQAAQNATAQDSNATAIQKGATAGALEGLSFGLGKYPVAAGAYIADRARGSKNPVSFDEALKLSEQEITSRKEAAPVTFGVAQALGAGASSVVGARALGADKLLGQSATARNVAGKAKDALTRISTSPEPIGAAVKEAAPVAKVAGKWMAEKALSGGKSAAKTAANTAVSAGAIYGVDKVTDGGIRQWFGSMFK